MENVKLEITEEKIKDIELYIDTIALRVGELVRQKRRENSLTIAELAKLSHVSSTVITDLENARSLPRTEVLLKLIYPLGLSYIELFQQFAPDLITREEMHIIPRNRDEDLKQELKWYGFGNIDIKEIMEFIAFIKYRNRSRK